MAYGLKDNLFGSSISRIVLEMTMDHHGMLNSEIAEIIDHSNSAAENS